MYKYILFDLDGTLTDSAPGIIRCIQYALEKTGKGTWDAADLFRFIGPPLDESFEHVCGMNPAEVKQALEYFRERFVRFGMFENSVYEGVPELLEKLHQAGFTMAVATSKPQEYAQKIIKNFNLDKYFVTIAGPGFNGELPTKADVIAEVLRRLELSASDKDSVIMLGDREHDALGARANGIEAFGAAYGYGAPGELEAAGVKNIARQPLDFEKFLLAIN